MTATGQVRLLDTHIGGELSMTGASVHNPGQVAVEGFSLNVNGSMLCDGLSVRGDFDLVNARIKGQLSMNGATLESPGRQVLIGDGMTVEGGTFRKAGFHAIGEVRLVRAELGKQLSLDGGASFENPGKAAVQAQGMSLRGDLLGAGVQTVGQLRLDSADITGVLDLSDATLSNSADIALNMDGSVIGQDLLCSRAHVGGDLSLVDARIAGQLQLDDAHLEHQERAALLADRVSIAGGLSGRRLRVTGEMRLPGAQIGGQLTLSGAHLDARPAGTAFSGERLTVTDFLCQDGFGATGEIRLVGARIAGQLGLQGAQLESSGLPALNLQQASVNSLWFSNATIVQGTVDLTAASLGVLHDLEFRWPATRLDGLEYADLRPAAANGARGRLAWLGRSAEGYRPQSYEQLAGYYRKLGNDQDARTVLLAKQRRRRAEMRPEGRLFGYVLDILVGYGYRPEWAFGWLLGLLALGSVYFDHNHPMPVNATQHPDFQPVLYAASLIIPIVNLGQNNAWISTGASQWVAAFLVAMGWILATAVVAAVTRTLTRN